MYRQMQGCLRSCAVQLLKTAGRTACTQSPGAAVLNRAACSLSTQINYTKNTAVLTSHFPDTLYCQQRSYAKKGGKGKSKPQKGAKKGSKARVELSDEELGEVIDHNKMKMQLDQVLEHLQQEYMTQLKVRTSSGVFDQLLIHTEDGKFPLIEIAQIAQKNPSLIMINLAVMPQYLPAVKEAIQKSGMNLNPQQEGTTLFVPVPKVSREHRETLAKSAKTLCDQSKERIRDVQNKYTKDSKKKRDSGVCPEDLGRSVEEYIRQTYMEYTQRAEDLMHAKQKELLGNK